MYLLFRSILALINNFKLFIINTICMFSSLCVCVRTQLHLHAYTYRNKYECMIALVLLKKGKKLQYCVKLLFIIIVICMM